MNCLPLVPSLVLLLHSALGSLPAPVNVTVESVNFHHVLRWDPGPGTPPGTRYKVFRYRMEGGKRKRLLLKSSSTSVKLSLIPRQEYLLTVQAFHKRTLTSNTSAAVRFTPYEDTLIDPPKLSLAGCGTCIQINISMPAAGVDIHAFYYPTYRVVYQRRRGKEVTYDSGDRSFTLKNLQSGTEYCVQVHPMIRLNRNTVPSARECVFTSGVETSGGELAFHRSNRIELDLRRPHGDLDQHQKVLDLCVCVCVCVCVCACSGPLVAGTVSATVLSVLAVLSAFLCFLYHTGFISKLKEALPRGPVAALSRGYILTPERTVPDHIFLSPEVEMKNKHQNPRTPVTEGSDLEEEEDEDEEEGGVPVYIDGARAQSSGEGPSGGSADAAEDRTLIPSGDSQGSEEEVRQFEDDEEEAEGAEVCLIPEENVTDEAGQDEVAFDSSGDVDLLTLTFAAFARCEEEEQNARDSLTNCSRCSDVERLIPTDSQAASCDQTPVVTQGFAGSGYEVRRAATDVGMQEEEEEEEDEEFSGYMRHA
ncbi:cytokine receptor family member b1 isoform X1 [Brachionichthys hirsutus]|uniref:cytokine receptor family member b1 isoform X1 n=1 Tax=Brachionichthys hirsutus TaxID=412623 RepID=UPI003604F15B